MEKVVNNKEESNFLNLLKDIVKSARQFAYNSVNLAQLRQNWYIGQKLVVQEQKGKDRSEYGKHVIKIASKTLTEEFGSGYSETNLRSFRKFYLTFKDYAIGQTLSARFEDTKRQALIAQSDKTIQQTGSAKSKDAIQQILPAILSWSHYERLMRIKDKIIRDWYMKEAAEQMWNFRTLDRNIRMLDK